MTMTNALSEELESVLAAAVPGALFVTELASRLGVPVDQIETTLDALRSQGELLITEHDAPDEHISGDFRIVALSGPDAAAASDARWNRWIRGVLDAHRCG